MTEENNPINELHSILNSIQTISDSMAKIGETHDMQSQIQGFTQSIVALTKKAANRIEEIEQGQAASKKSTKSDTITNVQNNSVSDFHPQAVHVASLAEAAHELSDHIGPQGNGLNSIVITLRKESRALADELEMVG